MGGMARPLRIERPGGRYHVTARGNERKAVYRDDTDRFHFLELLSEATERFGIRIHAYVLMDNHFHQLLETPEANLSRAMQWLNVSYSVWFNRRHKRVGHLFQGRFKSLVIEDEYTEQPVRQGVLERPWDRLVGGLVLGSEAFARQLRKKLPANEREQRALRNLEPRL
jgi:REP element-mobilizing transposase RayT